VANVLRRFRLNHEDRRQLRAIYSSFDEATARDRVVRWRITHAFGQFDSEGTVQLLFKSLDGEEYFWVRYGAARALTEIAATTANAYLRAQILAGFQSRIGQLAWPERSARSQKALEVFRRTIFYSGHVPAWEADVTPVLELIIRTQIQPSEQARWRGILADFQEFCRSHAAGAPTNPKGIAERHS
jgi:hypothetical protein